LNRGVVNGKSSYLSLEALLWDAMLLKPGLTFSKAGRCEPQAFFESALRTRVGMTDYDELSAKEEKGAG